jgi:hypothetical protein
MASNGVLDDDVELQDEETQDVLDTEIAKKQAEQDLAASDQEEADQQPVEEAGTEAEIPQYQKPKKGKKKQVQRSPGREIGFKVLDEPVYPTIAEDQTGLAEPEPLAPGAKPEVITGHRPYTPPPKKPDVITGRGFQPIEAEEKPPVISPEAMRMAEEQAARYTTPKPITPVSMASRDIEAPAIRAELVS